MRLTTAIQPHTLLSFFQWANWTNVLELLIASNLLAVMMNLAALDELQQFSALQLIQQMLFISWIAISFWCCVAHLPARIQKLHSALLFGLCLLLIIGLIVMTHCLVAILNFYLLRPNILLQDYVLAGLFKQILLGVCVAGLCLRYIYIRDQWIRRRQSELLAKVQALQSRIQPHFLFNSLNSVISLIAIDPQKAEQMLLDLSSLFRASLTELKEVTLSEEIELCQKYLDIEHMRLGERLRVTWKIDSDQHLSQVKIPLLTLQPLVENCIYHGVETSIQASEVKILIEVIAQRVNIVLINPYSQHKPSVSGHGMAIENIRQRLVAHYGSSVNLSSSARHGYFTMLLSYKL